MRTPLQTSNLAKLALFLRSKRSTKHFAMEDCCAKFHHRLSPTEVLDNIHSCGTTACALGHGPLAGVKPNSHRWDIYCESNFGVVWFSPVWFYMFSAHWPNSPSAAAVRIAQVITGQWTASPSTSSQLPDKPDWAKVKSLLIP